MHCMRSIINYLCTTSAQLNHHLPTKGLSQHLTSICRRPGRWSLEVPGFGSRLAGGLHLPHPPRGAVFQWRGRLLRRRRVKRATVKGVAALGGLVVSRYHIIPRAPTISSEGG